MCVTTPSTWPWIAHLVSGLHLATTPLYSNSLSLRLPYPVRLATKCKSLTHYAKGTQSPFRAPTVCMHAVSGFSFTPLPGFFSPFPHGTRSLSVDHEYLALEDGPPFFGQDSTCPALLLVNSVPLDSLQLQGYHLLWPGFPSRSSARSSYR